MNSIEKGIFPDDLKLADVSPIFKKEDSFDKESYVPVSIKQIIHYDYKFFTYLCSFKKTITLNNSLLKMVEIWKKDLDKGDKIGVILTDFHQMLKQ